MAVSVLSGPAGVVMVGGSGCQTGVGGQDSHSGQWVISAASLLSPSVPTSLNTTTGHQNTNTSNTISSPPCRTNYHQSEQAEQTDHREENSDLCGEL